MLELIKLKRGDPWKEEDEDMSQDGDEMGEDEMEEHGYEGEEEGEMDMDGFESGEQEMEEDSEDEEIP